MFKSFVGRHNLSWLLAGNLILRDCYSISAMLSILATAYIADICTVV